MCRTWQISINHCISQNINFFLDDWKPSLSPFPANRYFLQKSTLFSKKVIPFLEKWAIPSPVQSKKIGFFVISRPIEKRFLPSGTCDSVTVAIVTRKNHLKSGRRREGGRTLQICHVRHIQPQLDYTRRAGWPRSDCMCRTWQIWIIHCKSQNSYLFLEDWKSSLSPFLANRDFLQKLSLFAKKWDIF